MNDLTDRDLAPVNRILGNMWRSKYFELLHTIRGANKGVKRLQKKLVTVTARCAALEEMNSNLADTNINLAERYADIAATVPQAEPILAKHQACGCVICTCEDNEENRCMGCGAKNCGTHPVGLFPNPTFAAPAALRDGEVAPIILLLQDAIDGRRSLDRFQLATIAALLAKAYGVEK